MIGGSMAQIDFVGNVRVLFDFCYGDDLLPGSVLDIPDSVDLNTDVIMPIIGAIQASPYCAFAITQIDQTPVPFTTPNQLVESFVRIIGFNYRGFADVSGRTHQHTPFDNWDTVYTGALPQPFLDAANASVGRYQRTPDATAYLSHYFEPTGDLEIPVLTLHTRWDPVVPIFHEDIYQQAVAAAGKSDLLVQRTVMQYGHCQFADEDAASVAIALQAFEDLVNWVENGVTPTP
jgi:pimeloyl-ACP methyl ester carboxylesterase